MPKVGKKKFSYTKKGKATPRRVKLLRRNTQRRLVRRCDEVTKYYDIMCLATVLTVMLPTSGCIALFLALVLPPKVLNGPIR